MESRKFSMEELCPIIKDIIGKNGRVCLTVTGMSMYPLLRSRVDSVLLANAKDIKKYDIALYRRNDGKYILHRILKINNNHAECAGDNEIEIEKDVPVNSIIAKVVQINRGNIKFYTDNRIYRLYCMLWHIAFPLRHSLLKTYLNIRRKS